MASLKEMRDAANAWAIGEAAAIQSGAKKVPLTSNEKAMADKDLAAVKTTNLSSKAKASKYENSLQGTSAAKSGLGRQEAAQTRKWAGEGEGGQIWGHNKTVVKDEPYSDLAPSKHLSSNPPAAAQSRMDANKPLKTALVREVEPEYSRDKDAKTLNKMRKGETGFKYNRNDRVEDRAWKSAAETGEAQRFVGQMKPGVAERTADHSFQSKSDLHERLSEVAEQHMSENPDKYPRKPLWNQGARDTFDAARGVSKNIHNDAVDLGEAVPGASKAQGLRARAIARSIHEGRSETTDAAAKKARTDKAFSEMSQEKAPNQSKVSAGGQRFAPKLTADPRVESEFAGQTKSNIERPNKDLGRITTRLIRSAGTEGSNITEAGGGILKSALGKRLGQFVAKVGKGASMAGKAASKFGGALGLAGGIAGAADARQQYQDMLNSPNKMDLNTGKVSKRVNPRTQT
jgi:hypothetical protein